MKIEVTINCPELIESLNDLVKILQGNTNKNIAIDKAVVTNKDTRFRALTNEEITIDKVRQKLLEVSKLGYEDYVKDLIKSFGVIKLTDIDPKYYSEILEKVKILN